MSFNINRILWTVPFLSCLAGYYFFSWIFHVKSVKTPAVIGKTVQEALSVLSENNLNTRLQATKEVMELPSGTVLSQIPLPNTTIKPNQQVYLVVSTKPHLHTMPQLINKPLQESIDLLKAAGITYKIHYLASNQTKNSCFSQYPAAGQALKNNKVILYVSNGSSKPTVLPDFRGKPIALVIEKCATHPITTSIEHTNLPEENHTCTQSCIVIDQRPLPGSIVTFDDNQPLHLQLQVQTVN